MAEMKLVAYVQMCFIAGAAIRSGNQLFLASVRTHTAIQSIGISISLKIFEYLRTIRAWGAAWGSHWGLQLSFGIGFKLWLSVWGVCGSAHEPDLAGGFSRMASDRQKLAGRQTDRQTHRQTNTFNCRWINNNIENSFYLYVFANYLPKMCNAIIVEVFSIQCKYANELKRGVNDSDRREVSLAYLYSKSISGGLVD